jgi:hypothetical protein
MERGLMLGCLNESNITMHCILVGGMLASGHWKIWSLAKHPTNIKWWANQQHIRMLGCVLENLVVDYFTWVIKVATVTLGFFFFEIRSKQETLSLYCKFLCLVDLSNVKTKPWVLFLSFYLTSHFLLVTIGLQNSYLSCSQIWLDRHVDGC